MSEKARNLKLGAAKAGSADAEVVRLPRRQGRASAESAANPRKELVQEHLVGAAAEIFAAKGYANTSMSDIANALGLGRSAIYHYFRNKEDILRALVEREALQPYNSLIEIARSPGTSASERLRRVIVDSVLRRLTGGARLVVLNRLEMEMPHDVESLYTRSRRQILDIFVGIISDGIAAGEFRQLDAKVSAFTVLGMANWTSRWYSPKGKKTPQEIAEIIADIAIAGLSANGSGREAPDSVGSAVRLLKQDLEALERLTR